VQEIRKVSKKGLQHKGIEHELSLDFDSDAHISQHNDISPLQSDSKNEDKAGHRHGTHSGVITILTFCTCNTQFYWGSHWIKTKQATHYKQKLNINEHFLFSWNYANAGGRDKQILHPVLEHIWWRMLPTVWCDYTGNVLYSIILQTEHDQRHIQTLVVCTRIVYYDLFTETKWYEALLHIQTLLHFSDHKNEPDMTNKSYDRLWKTRTISDKLTDA
jgi:hypothetical protein